MQAKFFPSPASFRAWLDEHSDVSAELWVGFHKKSSGRKSMTWPEAVDEALCFGWIDGVRKTIDEASYAIRFTPRRPSSTWSRKNSARAEELLRLGLMRAPGRAAFEMRKEGNSAKYAYEQKRVVKLNRAYEQQMRANARAWSYFEDQTPSYRKAAIWWVMSAKREKTRLRRLSTLIQDSRAGRTIRPLTRRRK